MAHALPRPDASVSGHASAGTRTLERRFFLVLSLAIAAVVLGGFGRHFALGRASWEALPLQVHLHAGVAGAWIVLFVIQSALAARGSLTLHRRLGWLGAALGTVMAALSIVTAVMAMQRGAIPRFFPPSVFLAGNVLEALAFLAALAAGVALRRQPDWHRRLMALAAILTMIPALNRLLPLPVLGSFAPFAAIAAMLMLTAAGIVFDLIVRRRVHPAWWVGAGGIIGLQVLMGALALLPPVRALAAYLSA